MRTYNIENLEHENKVLCQKNGNYLINYVS